MMFLVSPSDHFSTTTERTRAKFMMTEYLINELWQISSHLWQRFFFFDVNHAFLPILLFYNGIIYLHSKIVCT